MAGAAEAAAAKEAAAREAAREAAVKEAAAREAAAMEVEAGKAAEARKTADAARKAEQAADRATAERIDAAIKGAIAQARSGTVPNIDVKATEEGVLISLTDDYDFGMFAIASAEPRPAMVVVMEKLAKVLAAQLRAARRARPHRWPALQVRHLRQLAAFHRARAHGLLHAGARRHRREALRARRRPRRSQPRVADDPDAAQNRRIEILLRKAKP